MTEERSSDVNDFRRLRYEYEESPNIPPTAPSVFMDDYTGPPVHDLEYQVNEQLPRSDGGPIEAVKRAILMALREALSNTSLSISTQGTQVHTNLEYPLKEEQYPGIWIQFQTTKLQRAGLAHEVWEKVDDEWQAIYEMMFDGRVTLTVMALTSLERDRISDAIVSQIGFARVRENVITKATDTKQYRTFLTALYDNPYVMMTVNTDVINSGGQSVNMGVPWQEDILAYVDSYSFDLSGQFAYVFNKDGTYKLRELQEYPAPLEKPPIFPFQRDPTTPQQDVTYNVPQFRPI